MYSISNNILANNEDVEECLDDVYIKMWDTIPPVIPKSLVAYVGKVTRNISLDKHRMRNSQKRGNGEFALVLDELAEIVADNQDIENDIINMEVVGEINQYLASITKEKRMMFVMRYYHSYSIKEISKHFKSSDSKVKMTLMRLRSEIKSCLIEKGMTL